MRAGPVSKKRLRSSRLSMQLRKHAKADEKAIEATQLLRHRQALALDIAKPKANAAPRGLRR